MSLVRASRLELKQMTIRDPGEGRQTCFLFSKSQLKFTNVCFESGGVMIACDPGPTAKGMTVIFENCTFTNKCTLFMGDNNGAEVHRTASCVGWDKVNVVGTPNIKAL